MYNLVSLIVFSKHGTKILFPILCLLIPSYNTYVTLESVNILYSNNIWNQLSHEPITINFETIKPLMAYWIMISGVYSIEMMTNNVITELPFYDELKLALFLGLQTRNNSLSVKLYDNYIKPFVIKNKENIESVTKRIYNLIRGKPEVKREYDSEDDEYFLQKIVKSAQTRGFALKKVI